MKKKTEIAIDEDLLTGAMEAAEEVGVDFGRFVENGRRPGNLLNISLGRRSEQSADEVWEH